MGERIIFFQGTPEGMLSVGAGQGFEPRVRDQTRMDEKPNSSGVAPFRSKSQSHRFIFSASDFAQHVYCHKRRVEILGLELAQHHFPNLNQEELKQYLKLHDASKTMMMTEELRRYGYQHHQTPIDRLYRNFTKSLKTDLQAAAQDGRTDDPQQDTKHDDQDVQPGGLHDGLKANQCVHIDPDSLLAIVADLNAIDQTVHAEFRASRPHLRPVDFEQMAAVELIADLVDRGSDPVAEEEFSRPMAPASKLLRNPTWSQLALWLEERYAAIAGHVRLS